MEDLFEIDRRRGGFMDTYEGRGKEADFVLVPWKVFSMVPDRINPAFHRNDDGILEYNENNVNVMFAAQNIQKSSLGYLNEFQQTWMADITNMNELNDLRERMYSRPTVIGVTLDVASIFPESMEVPMVIFFNPKLIANMSEIHRGFSAAEEALQSNKKFSVEFDFSSIIEEWASNVLGRNFVCMGGKLCLTNGKLFNHIFDWKNLAGCMWLLPCCMVANPLYRIRRKMKYEDRSVTIRDYIPVVWGAVDFHPKEQMSVLQKLVYLCIREKMNQIHKKRMEKGSAIEMKAVAGSTSTIQSDALPIVRTTPSEENASVVTSSAGTIENVEPVVKTDGEENSIVSELEDNFPPDTIETKHINEKRTMEVSTVEVKEVSGSTATAQKDAQPSTCTTPCGAKASTVMPTSVTVENAQPFVKSDGDEYSTVTKLEAVEKNEKLTEKRSAVELKAVLGSTATTQNDAPPTTLKSPSDEKASTGMLSSATIENYEPVVKSDGDEYSTVNKLESDLRSHTQEAKEKNKKRTEKSSAVESKAVSRNTTTTQIDALPTTRRGPAGKKSSAVKLPSAAISRVKRVVNSVSDKSNTVSKLKDDSPPNNEIRKETAAMVGSKHQETVATTSNIIETTKVSGDPQGTKSSVDPKRQEEKESSYEEYFRTIYDGHLNKVRVLQHDLEVDPNVISLTPRSIQFVMPNVAQPDRTMDCPDLLKFLATPKNRKNTSNIKKVQSKPTQIVALKANSKWASTVSHA